MTEEVQSLSTSALAKKLGKSSKQMFAELEALGWIVREGDHWTLTAKGTFEGGHYKESKRFGTYVVWPVSVIEHRALVNPDSQLLSAAAVGKLLSCSAVQMNRMFNELGWIERHIKGWRLTEAGTRYGGRQSEDARSGVPYVLWPETITVHPALQASRIDTERNIRLPAEVSVYQCLDGHQLPSAGLQKIDDWLYTAGVVHACQRRLPIEEEAVCDFYIPAARLYIEFWDEQDGSGYLAEKMRRKELYQRYQLNMIELSVDDLPELDETLSRRLLKQGLDTL
ncbi:hypothetical protein [Pontibacterium sp.]|uniref:hypothetical protein n=1 Tax=Pontibacterium sp. TaxID=2036026 RepID=UPI003569E924